YRQTYSTRNKSKEKLAEEAQALYDRFRDYIDFLPRKEGKTVYTLAEHDTLLRMLASAQGHSFARQILWQESVEGHLLALTQPKFTFRHEQEEFSALELKAMLDRLLFDFQMKRVHI